ncbi:phosphoglycerate dehydrogenase [Paenibacillus caui]|uniref:phosphoglycerate dehydrogenase n=1 Tax=Paenibacillus caui TaxID=2873927 RepID=UPI001F480B45|nr:phosphoglycerate dehydrogenase [Paenibacillus caui]
MPTNFKVLVTATNYGELCGEAKQRLENYDIEVIENPFGRPLTFEELRERIGDIDAVIAGIDTWNEAVFQLAPKLKAIARFGVGVDNIDIEKARDYGIKVTNAPRLNSNAVAELTVGLILGILRNIPALDHSTRLGSWERFVGDELDGRSIGLLGFGNIAQMVAKKLQGFDVQLRAFDKYPNVEKAKEYRVEIVSLEDVLQKSDIVTLHLPSLPETKYFMNDERFGMMKPHSYFVNTSRGLLVEENALYRALTSGSLKLAAIDVYEHEPVLPSNPLLGLPNLIATPHTAAETFETYRSVGLLTAEAIIDWTAEFRTICCKDSLSDPASNRCSIPVLATKKRGSASCSCFTWVIRFHQAMLTRV